jgi:4-amino-4-deoxy-L-arabinose transferase-like glycosyltransferase
MTPLRTAVTWMARSSLRAFILIFLLGFSIRFFFLTQVPERRILPHDRWEDTAIATSLVERGEFADPYMIPTGPTAHLPPLVPGTLALFWSLFGMGLAGGYAARLFSIAACSALYALVPWFGGKLGLSREAGVLGGIVGSLIMVGAGNGEETAGIIIGLMAIVFLRRWTTGLGSFGSSFLLGAAAGAAFHLQPVLLPVVLGWMIFELWWSRDRRKWLLSGVLVLGMIVACAPWGWRNYTVFNEVFFIRDNLGLELRMGNHEGATGHLEKNMRALDEYRHPRTNPVEARLVQELGEAEYMRRAKAEAIGWITANPWDFLKLTASRTTQFWVGPLHQPGTALAVTALTLLALLGAWYSLPGMTPPQRATLLTPLICYPLVYYVVIYMPRYRVPLDWILVLLAGAAVWRSIKSPVKVRDSTSGSV